MLLSAVALVSRLIHSHNRMLSEDNKKKVNQILAYSFEGEENVGNEIRQSNWVGILELSV